MWELGGESNNRMINYNEIKYNNNICNNEHFVQRAAESPRRETPRGLNDYVICNPQNNNGNGLFNDLLNFLNNPNIDEIKEPIQSIAKYEHYKLYPVPSTDVLTIEYDFEGDADAEMIIYDLLGREVIKTVLSNSNTTVSIPMSNLKQGVFTYKIKVGTESYTGKILKQ